MNDVNAARQDGTEQWLRQYYLARAAFAFAWVLAASSVAPHAPGIAAALLVLYPAWDAAANLVDALKSGGLARNRTQAANLAVSLAVAAGIAAALPDMNRVLGIFGAWAILSGLLQLGTGLHRWKRHGAQWAMILSGAQSALAGAFFLFQARQPQVPSIATVAGYAGFGAFYFGLSGVLLGVRAWRRRRA